MIVQTETDKLEAPTDRRAADLTEFLQLTPSCCGKIPFKHSWLRILIRINTKIERFIASETSHPSETFHKNFFPVISKIR